MNYDDIELIDDESYVDVKYLGFPLNKVLLKRTTHDGNNKPLSMNLEYRESAGNKKIFDLAGVLLVAFISEDDPFLIVIDEIDSNFHPSLLIKLIGMFNNPKINRSNSQLLFTSHDTNLMSPSIMRRDQFYFAEKQEDESTRCRLRKAVSCRLLWCFTSIKRLYRGGGKREWKTVNNRGSCVRTTFAKKISLLLSSSLPKTKRLKGYISNRFRQVT